MPFFERADERDVLRPFARGRDQPHRNRLLHAGDDEQIADALLVHHVRRAIAIARLDVLAVGVGRLGDVRIGRDDSVVHRAAVSNRDGAKSIMMEGKAPAEPWSE